MHPLLRTSDVSEEFCLAHLIGDKLTDVECYKEVLFSFIRFSAWQ